MEEQLSLRKRRKENHQARLWRHWAAGEWCWCVTDDAWEEEITGWDPRSTRDPSSSSSFWPHQSDATSRLGPDLMPPSRPELMMKCQCKNPKRHMFLLHILRRVKRFHQMYLWPRLHRKIQCRQLPCVTFCPNVLPNPLDRVEPPERTRGDDDDHSSLLSAYHHDLEKVSGNLKDGEECLQWNRDA